MISEAMQPAIPEDLALYYQWQAGTMPPPHHYEYAIRVGPGMRGEIVFWPDYPQHNPPVWREALAVPEEALADLYRVLREVDVFTRVWRRAERSPIGDCCAWLEATAGGRTVRLPAHLAAGDAAAIAPVYEAVRALVPEALWARLMAQREAYVQAYHDQAGQ
jgi:hypothetical protein